MRVLFLTQTTELGPASRYRVYQFLPALRKAGARVIEATHHELGTYRLACDGSPELLFTDNDTNRARLYGEPATGWCKDGFHDVVVGGHREAVNPARSGTKCAAWHVLDLGPGASATVRLRLRKAPAARPFADFDHLVAQRRAEADALYRDSTR